MAQLLNGSVCLTDIIDKAKEKHSAFAKGKNGKIYFNVTCWVNDEPNQFGQHASLLLNSSKEKKDDEGKVYIGNMKKSEQGGAEPVSGADVNDLSQDLPF